MYRLMFFQITATGERFITHHRKIAAPYFAQADVSSDNAHR
jgi:hypothetical protein